MLFLDTLKLNLERIRNLILFIFKDKLSFIYYRPVYINVGVGLMPCTRSAIVTSAVDTTIIPLTRTGSGKTWLFCKIK
jgi:hypothetical protein